MARTSILMPFDRRRCARKPNELNVDQPVNVGKALRRVPSLREVHHQSLDEFPQFVKVNGSDPEGPSPIHVPTHTRTGSGAAADSTCSVSPWARPVRMAMAAATTKKMLLAKSARWTPEVSATGPVTCTASR
jgi:hypothetical protein